MRSVVSQSTELPLKPPDETAYILALTEDSHGWIEAYLTTRMPRIADLAAICEHLGWNWHIYSHKGEHYAMVKCFAGAPTEFLTQWGPEAELRIPEHALLVAMSAARRKDA